jgi:hypothetical protein
MSRQDRLTQMGDLGNPDNKESMMDKVIDFISYPFTSNRETAEEKFAVEEKHNKEIKELLDKIIKDEDRGTYISKSKIFLGTVLGIGLPVLLYKLNKKRKNRRSRTRSRTRKTL